MADTTQTEEVQVRNTLPYYLAIYRLDKTKTWQFLGFESEENKLQKMLNTLNAAEKKILKIALPV